MDNNESIKFLLPDSNDVGRFTAPFLERPRGVAERESKTMDEKHKKALIEATAILEDLNKNWTDANKSQDEFWAKVDRFILVVDMLLLAVAVTMAVFHEPAMWR